MEGETRPWSKSEEWKTSCFRNSSHLPRGNLPPTPALFQVFPAASNLLYATWRLARNREVLPAGVRGLRGPSCPRGLTKGVHKPGPASVANVRKLLPLSRADTGSARPAAARSPRPGAPRGVRGCRRETHGERSPQAHLDAPGLASSGPGYRTAVSGSARGAPAPPDPLLARRSPARLRPAPGASRPLLPGKWPGVARSPCPPRGGSPMVPGPGGLSAGRSWRNDPREQTGQNAVRWSPRQLSEKERAARARGAWGRREEGARGGGSAPAAPPRPSAGGLSSPGAPARGAGSPQPGPSTVSRAGRRAPPRPAVGTR